MPTEKNRVITEQPESEELPTISTFWYGPDLPLWPYTCLKSFVNNGHDVHLYTYDPSVRVPDGVTIKTAESILPENSLFLYRQGAGKGSVAGFANIFRYAMLYEKGGYWVDTDVICRKPFPNFGKTTVAKQDGRVINNAIIYATRGDKFLESSFVRAQEIGDKATWGQAGPRLLTALARSGDFDINIVDKEFFYPVPFTKVISQFLLPENKTKAQKSCENSAGIHLFNEIYRMAGVDTSDMPPPGSFLHEEFSKVLGTEAPYEHMRASQARLGAAKYFFLAKKYGLAARGRRFIKRRWPLAVAAR